MKRRISAGVLATVASLAATLGLGAVPASAAPAAPVLSSPAQSATATTNPVFSWNRVSGAARYSVQVATQSDFASGTVTFSQSTANTYATPLTDLATGQYWWRVAAVDSSNLSSPYSSTWTFTKATADAPVPRTPVDGATLAYPTQSLILSWDPMPGAKTYEVQIDDDPAFVGAANPVATPNNSYTPALPPLGTTSYWRVRAKSSSGVPSQYSAPQSYTMVWNETVSSDPATRSPANTNASTVEEVVLDWAPLRGASAYELQISPDQYFNAPIGGTLVVNSTSYSPSPTLPAGAYYWRVRGLSTAQVAEPSPWSDVWVFTRAWPASTASTRPNGTEANLYPQVQLLSPADGDYSLTEPVFTWKPQREAAMYEFQVGRDVNFSPGTYNICFTNHTSLSPYARVNPLTLKDCVPNAPITNQLSPGVPLYWRVRAVDDLTTYTPNPKINGVYSDVRSFLYDPSLVVQTAPVNGATVPVPVLRWNAVDNISHYKVTIAPVTAVTGCAQITANTYNTTYVPETLSDKCTGQMRWTVQSIEEDGSVSRMLNAGSWPTFTIAPPAPDSTMGVVATTASDGLRPPLMQWSPLATATKYVVSVSVAGANSYSPATSGTTQPAYAYTGESPALAKTLAPGAYTFFVSAYNSAGSLLETSAVGSFSISDYPRATLITPKCQDGIVCTLHDTPTLDWEPISNVGLYRVYIATDPNFTNIIREWATPFSQMTPVESLPDSQAGEAYYWYVRPCYTGTGCAPFDTSVFPLAGAFRKESLPVEGLSPKVTNQVTPTVADEVTFRWTDYLATNMPKNNTVPVGSAVPEVVTQEARAYEVQVSTTAEFTNIIETSPRVDQTTYTAKTKTYPEGPLFWRVRAYDASDNPLTYSCAQNATTTQPACSAFAFQKVSPAPTQTLPTNRATVNSAPVMAWDAMPYAKTYQVEVYKSPDSALNPTNRVGTVLTTRDSATIGITSLPAGDYGWRVRRVDVNNLPGAWTTEDNLGLQRFTVAGPAVNLSLPSAGASVQPYAVLLQWVPVAGASRYRVDVSTDSFATVMETATTDMTSWAPGLLIKKWPAGPYQWRVTTLDSTGAALAVSETRSFTVTGPAVVERWAGPDRFSASAAISAKSFPVGVNVAYIASGMNFPDALSGAPVAGLTAGPVLLSRKDSLDKPITDELTRLKPKKIVILGGPGSVSDVVRTTLANYTAGAVDRWFGPDRYSASAAISAKSFPVGVNVAYIASGTTFPDALSGAPVAGKTAGPVLLSRKDSIDKPITDELARLQPKKIVILGGPGSVSDAVKATLGAYTAGSVDRWYGPDRYSASADISAKSFPVGVDVAYVASGSTFPDALSGAPVAGKTPGPVLLARKDSLDRPITDELTRLKPKRIVILGGAGSVSDNVKALLQSYLP